LFGATADSVDLLLPVSISYLFQNVNELVYKQHDSEWAKLYERLVPRMCAYDERTQAYVGRGKVLGRIAGQLIGMFTEVFLFVPNIESDQAC